MNREDIIRMAREAGIEWQSNEGITGRVRVTTCGSQSIEKIERLVQSAYATGAAAERNKLAAWMIQRGYATGHGDTTENLLKELDWQVLANWSSAMKTGAENEREACAAICDRFQARDVGMQPAECAGAIRARGQK